MAWEGNGRRGESAHYHLNQGKKGMLGGEGETRGLKRKKKRKGKKKRGEERIGRKLKAREP